MKKRTADLMLAVSILLIAAVAVYGVVHGRNKPAAGDAGGRDPHFEEDGEIYYLEERTLAEFSEVIVEQMRKESRLVVFSVDTSVSLDLKQTGIWDLDILNKTQKVTYRGTARFYVDMSLMGSYAVSLDNEKEVVTIAVPHTRLAEIEIDPDKFTAEEAKKGLLAFGELKFTFREYNVLEAECKRRIRESADVEENYRTADARAVEELTKLFEPAVKAVDAAYRVEIVFVDVK